MNPPRYSVSRRRACVLCSDRKVRCDRAPGRCTTCAQRGEHCHYPSHSRPTKSSHSVNAERAQRQNESPIASSETSSSANNESHSFIFSPQQSPSGSLADTERSGSILTCQTDHASDPECSKGGTQPPGQAFNFTDLELTCPINADEIQNRWLSSYISGPGQTKKTYPANVVSFMSRMLKSYAVAAVENHGWPPFVHFSQITSDTSTYLSTCLTLVQVFAKDSRGDRDNAVTAAQREMSKIHQSIATSDDMGKLAMFQAYLIYTMVLYFCLDDLPKPFLREAMIKVQELACASSRGGLVCFPKQQSSTPKWEAWIAVEAKRRTVYTMYMFDSVLLCRDGLDNYLGTELRGLPAPGEKRLWQARVRSEWEKLYSSHLVAWPDGALRIDELWPMPADSDEVAVVERRRRIDDWLQGIDEYGTMLFAVTCCTHGS